MRIPRLLGLATLALVATVALPAAAPAADKPSNKTLYHDGPQGRFLMDGQWLFRLDAGDDGVKQRFMRQTGTEGWAPVRVPNVWNLGDPSNESMAGSIGWYRKDFELPDAEPRAGLGGALRVGQLPHARVAERQARRREPRRLHPVRVPAEHGQAARHEPARRARRLAPVPDRLPAVGPERRRRAHRRLVELRRHPARGLPAAGRHGRLQERPRAPAARLRGLRLARLGLGRPAQRHRRVQAGLGDRALRRPHACGSARAASRPAGSRASRRRSPCATRGCGHRRARTSTTSR